MTRGHLFAASQVGLRQHGLHRGNARLYRDPRAAHFLHHQGAQQGPTRHGLRIKQ